nr:FkbM family methyltransferase [Escherichia coli]
MLKIDTQGSELNILVGGEQVLNNTLCIQLEVSFIPLYEGQPSFGEIDVYLRKHGFLPHCIALLNKKNIMLYSVAQSIFGSNQLFEMDIVY